MNDKNEDFTSKYINKNLVGNFLIENYYKVVADLLKSVPIPKRAIEVGCGEGYSTMYLRKILTKNSVLVASDVISRQVKVAKKNNPGINIVQEDVYSLQRNDSEFDMVFLLEVLEHLDDPEMAIKEVRRVCRKYFIVGVPNEPLWRILNMLRGKYLKCFGNTPGHVNHWSTKTFIDLLTNNNFKIVKFSAPLPWTIVLARK